MTATTAIDLDRAKLDPASVFKTPKDVLQASGISIDDKKAILVRWEADTEALMRATEEGMPPSENQNRAPGEMLRAVQEAMQLLEKSGNETAAA